MKVIVFGKTGMLGNYVYKTLMTDYEVITIDRKDFDIESCDWKKLDEKIKLFSRNDIIINCIGSIPQRKPNIKQLIVVNTIFPLKLNEISKKYGLKLIHITTDCVFSGKKGNYTENDIHDSDENYGITKSLGENIDSCIIRTSIIGEEINNKLSLLEWVKNNKNGKINGYNNFYWNGITCLTLSKIIKDIIKNNSYWLGAKHFYSPNTVSKYELCDIINKIYGLNINIEDFKLNEPKNMTLSSIYDINYNIENIELQLQELYENSFKYITT
jgi:dTDP-4-dehydrorhamnose reductase